MKLLTLLILILPHHSVKSNLDRLPFAIDKEQITSQTLTYRMSMKGDSLGYSKITISKNKDYISIHEDSHVKAGFEMTEDMTTYLSVSTFQWDSVILYGAFNTTKTFESKGYYRNNNLSVSSNYNMLFGKPKTDIDTVYDYTLVERLASIFLFPPAINFDNKTEYEYMQFNSMDCINRKITIKKTTDQVIETPSGSVNTYKVELTGGVANQILYISKAPIRRIVRIEFKENDWIYDLVSD